jgi:phosphoglucosamine mutase
VKEVIAAVEKDLAGQGRVLIRKSGTEPLIRVMVEGKEHQQVQNFAEKIAAAVKIAS